MTDADFLRTIRQNPESDTIRLIYADWLEERDRPDEATRIRLGCEFEPNSLRFDDSEINALREELRKWNHLFPKSEIPVWKVLLKDDYTLLDTFAEWQRGFLHGLALPAERILSYGERLRERHPLLNRWVVFGLNEKGIDFAHSPAWTGMSELELACWYSDEDAQAIAESPNFQALEVFTYYAPQSWDEQRWEQVERFARNVGDNMRRFNLVTLGDEESQDWGLFIANIVGRDIAHVYDYEEILYPFDGFTDWCNNYIVGRLGDNRQIFAEACVWGNELKGLVFDLLGCVQEPFVYRLPEELNYTAYVQSGRLESEGSRGFWEMRERHLQEQFGFRRGFIRVEGFEYRAAQGFPMIQHRTSVRRHYPNREFWGLPEEQSPFSRITDLSGKPGGVGAAIYEDLHRQEFIFESHTTERCNREGRVVT